MKRTIQQAVDIIQKIDIANGKFVDYLLQHPQYLTDKTSPHAAVEAALHAPDVQKAVQDVMNEAKDDEDIAAFKAVAVDRIHFSHEELARSPEVVEAFRMILDNIAKHADKNQE